MSTEISTLFCKVSSESHKHDDGNYHDNQWRQTEHPIRHAKWREQTGRKKPLAETECRLAERV